MKNLNVPVTTLPKIGSRYKSLLAKVGVETIYDLVFHFPFRYEDLSKVAKIDELEEGETVTIEAKVLKIDNIYTRNAKKLTKAKVMDETGVLELVWFNQHYITDVVHEGETYYFSGKVKKFSGKINITSPQHEAIDGKGLNTARLVPVYSETKGLTSKWLRAKLDYVLRNLLRTDPLIDPIPDSIRNKENLLEINEGLKKIHFPENEQDISKARERFGFEELFIELLRVESRKREWHVDYKGVRLDYESNRQSLEKMINSLPFTLTPSQQKVIDEIHKDLDKPNPMNRLLEGDVGSGKTVVAVVASYLCYLNGYKVLYMAPTEILAKQHFETYKKFLDGFGLNIVLSTGNTKTKFKEVEDADIVVGTHALLYFKEDITNVGLVVVDEQHRFGVQQRAKLLDMGVGDLKPNMLTMTATPIPRTLALTLYGDLDISVLDAVPNKDKKITTRVVPESYREKSFKWIKARGEQAFIVCPFIEQSEAEQFENVRAAETEYERLTQGVFKGLSVGLLHGRMKPAEKEKVMQDFRDKKYQILVSTPVIEVGVDVPDATIMVIESAERFGLASLHQLRGRVGRGSKEGFCFLFMSGFSKIGFARLKNLENINNGLKLAEIDMQYRGQGDVFGTMQSGFKAFKVADLSDLEMIERAKKAAAEVYDDLDDYPDLVGFLQDSAVINN